MKSLHTVAFFLVIIGGLNWGLIGLSALANDGMMGGGNVVTMLLGSYPMVESLVYVLVGLSALKLVLSHKKDCKQCM